MQPTLGLSPSPFELSLTSPAAFGDKLLAAADGTVYIGEAKTIYRVRPGGDPEPVIENIVVDEPWRNAAVGAALMCHAEALCRDAACSKIMLLSSIGRRDAHRFFERHGFVGDSKRGFVKYRRQFS